MISAAECVTLVCSVTLLGLYTAVVASKSSRTGALVLLEVLAWPGWRRAQDREQPQMGARLAKLMDKKRGDLVMVASSVALCTLVFSMLWGLVNIVSGSNRILNSSQTSIGLALFGAHLLASLNHTLWSVRVNTLLVYVVTILLSTTFVTVTTNSRYEMMQLNIVAFIPRIMFSNAYLKSETVCLFCILHSFAATLRFSLLPPGSQYEFARITPFNFWSLDVLCSLVVVLSTLGLERIMTIHARQELEVTAKRGETTATRRLLNTICDATFELDEGLSIVDDALELASALQQGCDRSLRGTQAEQLLVAEDRALFRERIAAPVPASQSMANVLHVRMRDSLSNILKVELFHVPVAGSLIGASHLIGVREHADYGEHLFQEPLSSRGEVPSAPLRGPLPSATRLGTPAVALLESTSSGSEVASNREPVPGALRGRAAASLGTPRAAALSCESTGSSSGATAAGPSQSGSACSERSTAQDSCSQRRQLSNASYLQLMLQSLREDDRRKQAAGSGVTPEL